MKVKIMKVVNCLKYFGVCFSNDGRAPKEVRVEVRDLILILLSPFRVFFSSSSGLTFYESSSFVPIEHIFFAQVQSS